MSRTSKEALLLDRKILRKQLRSARDETAQLRADAKLGRVVRDNGLTIDDCEAVATIYGWAGNGSAPRIVATMRAIAAAFQAERGTR